MKVTQLTKTDKFTRTIINKYPIFVITFQPGTEISKVLQLCKLCHCIIRWEKFQNSRPIRQCFNCQAFSHSSNFCGRPPKCVKCDKQHTSKDCNKPPNAPPTSTNCGGEHPANHTGCPQYLQQLHHIPQKTNQQHRKLPDVKTKNPPFQYQQTQLPTMKIPQPSSPLQQMWAQTATQLPTDSTQQPISSTFESLRTIINMFNLQHLCSQMRLLATKLQETKDPIAKLVLVIDTVVECFSTHK